MKYKIKLDNRVYEVEISNLRARPIIARVDGETFEVWPEDIENSKAPAQSTALQTTKAEMPPVSMNIPTGGSLNANSVKAPIPGTVISIFVKPGDQVTLGQELCILEAMKMRNAIRAGRAGTIKTVQVSPGTTVNHNDLLFEFAE